MANFLYLGDNPHPLWLFADELLNWPNNCSTVPGVGCSETVLS
jgi:hypothetical protein